MLQTAQDKKKICCTFSNSYVDLCKLRGRLPLPGVKAHLSKHSLDFIADRIRFDDWICILNALRADKSLHFIAIRSRHSQSDVLENIDTERKARIVDGENKGYVRKPVILTKFIFALIAEALSQCITQNSVLSCLELEGLPLHKSYVELLNHAMLQNHSLQHVSFYRSKLGDEGCEAMCLCIRDLPNIITVDFSCCNISEKGARSISEMIKFQQLSRYGESWKQSLRYRVPDFDKFSGLRRILLNHNPQTGDKGLEHLVYVLKDDLWMKALDMQDCGVTNKGGTAALELLEYNKHLAIVDLRSNYNLDHELLSNIMRSLAFNNVNVPHEYNWISESRMPLPRKAAGHAHHRKPVPRAAKDRPATSHGIRRRNNLIETVPRPHSSPVPSQRSAYRVGSSIRPTKKDGIPRNVSVRLTNKLEIMEGTPGTPRCVQFEEPYPPWASVPPCTPAYQSSENVRQDMLSLTEKLEREVQLRKKVEAELIASRSELEFVTRQAKEDTQECVSVPRNTIQTVFRMFTELETVICGLGSNRCPNCSGVKVAEIDIDKQEESASEVEQEDDTIDSLFDNNSTFITRKSCSEQINRRLCVELDKVSKSTSKLDTSCLKTLADCQRVEKLIGDSNNLSSSFGNSDLQMLESPREPNGGITTDFISADKPVQTKIDFHRSLCGASPSDLTTASSSSFPTRKQQAQCRRSSSSCSSSTVSPRSDVSSGDGSATHTDKTESGRSSDLHSYPPSSAGPMTCPAANVKLIWNRLTQGKLSPEEARLSTKLFGRQGFEPLKTPDVGIKQKRGELYKKGNSCLNGKESDLREKFRSFISIYKPTSEFSDSGGSSGVHTEPAL